MFRLKTIPQFLCLHLLACSFVTAEPAGVEFTDIQLSRPVLSRHPSLGPVTEGKSALPDLKALDRLLNSVKSEPILFIELIRDRDDRYSPIYSPDGKNLAFIRADLDLKTSKIEILNNLAEGSVSTLLPDQESYDYMFSWRFGSTSTTKFCFASTAGVEQTMNLYLGLEDLTTSRLTNTSQLKKHPTLRVAENGTHHLLYEMEGDIMSMNIAVDGNKTNIQPRKVANGSFPEWSPSDSRFSYVKSSASNTGTKYGVAVQTEGQSPSMLVELQNRSILNPTWSPNGEWLALYRAGETKGRYDLLTVPTSGGDIHKLAEDVVIESNFDHVGPTWSPDSRRLFFFARRQQGEVTAVDESYYRLLSRSPTGSAPCEAFDYERRYTTAIAPAVNPNNKFPEVAFVATKGLSQGVYVLILNHYGH